MAEPGSAEPTSEQKLAALRGRSGDAGAVEAISTGGHVASAAILADGAAAAWSVGGLTALKCFAGRVVAPLGGAMAGAFVAQQLGLDEMATDAFVAMGATRIAKRGLAPAHVKHKIAHSSAFAGAFSGLLAGIGVGLVVAALLTAEVATAGAATPLLVGAAIAFTSGAAGGAVGAIVAGVGANTGRVTGMIVTGSPDVRFEGFAVARVTDVVACSDHSGSGAPDEIAEGSLTISVNGLPLARIGHKSVCSAVIQEGCVSIFADDTTGQFGPIDAEFSILQQLLMSAIEVIGMRSAVREGGALDGLLRDLFGEPVDVVTGEFVQSRTDYTYRSVLPLSLDRMYAGRGETNGLLGTRWLCSWSQTLTFATDGRSALLEDADGQRLRFATGPGELDSLHLKAPHYHLTGTAERARLFDSRTQRTLVFAPLRGDPYLGVLDAIEDRNCNRIEFVRQGGRLVRVTHSDGVAFAVQTDPRGRIECVTMEGEEQVLVRYAYDRAGGLADVEGFFTGEFHYAYDPEGRLVHWRNSGVTGVTLDYDAAGRVVGTRTPDGMFNDRFAYWPNERRSQYTDATGAAWSFWYDAKNLVTLTEDPLGAVTLTEWDSLERRRSTTDALGRVTRFAYDQAGRLAEAADWAGRTTRIAYDAHGQVTAIDHPGARRAAWAYDAAGNLVAELREGISTDFAYDRRGRLVSETQAGGAVRRWEYDAKGRLTAERDAAGRTVRFDVDRFGRVRSVTDSNGFATRYEHVASPANSRGAVSRILRPDGGFEEFDYGPEGLPSRRTRGEGQTTRFAYGAFDLLRRMTDAAGFDTTFEYDDAARLTGVTNASGARWTYGYDAAGRLASEADWAGRRTRYLRDRLGRVVSRTLPDGTEHLLTWDERDRVVGVAAVSGRVAYEYDDADRLTRAATFRQAADEPETDVRLEYDPAGRLVREVQNGVPVDYAYDEAGRRVGRSSPSGSTRTEFDPPGLQTALESNGHALRFERDGSGQETRRSLPAGSAADVFALHQSYDPCRRLVGQRAGLDLPTAALLRDGEVSRSYEWDRAGRLACVSDSSRGVMRYRHDLRDQIVHVERPPMGRSRLNDESFLYDALMNVSASEAGSHAYQGDCVVRAGGNTYTYDARGRMTSRTVARDGFRPRSWSYAWDDFDRLVEVRTPDEARWRYVYDAFGRRVSKRCVTLGHSASVSYVWDGAAVAEVRRSREDGAAGSVERWHYEADSFRPAAKEVLRPGGDGGSRFYPVVTDHLGTPKEVFSSEGRCLWRAEHSLWGRASPEHAAPPSGAVRLASLAPAGAAEDGFDAAAEAECELRFQNQWKDEESGLHYNLNRYYDPDSGQYLSQDTIGLAGGLRTHGYVHDPAGWIDPLGLADAPGTVTYPLNPGLTPQAGSYSSGIARAWSQEQNLVQTTGSGTVNWTPDQIDELNSTGRVSGYTGHHINNAAEYPDWEGDPRNIRFLQNGRSGTTNDHLYADQGHRGNWQNETKGRLIDRQEMIRRFQATCL